MITETPSPHELEDVPVAGNDENLIAFLPQVLRQSRQEIVGFIALELDHRDPQALEHLADQWKLLPKSVGCLRSPGLVFRIAIEPELRRALIKTYNDCIWTLVRQKFDEHRGKTIDGIGDLPGGSDERVGQGKKGAKRQ